MSTVSPKSLALTPEEHCACVLRHYEHLQDVWKELGNAIEKHPRFIDAFHRTTVIEARVRLATAREALAFVRAESLPLHFEDVLDCEIAEAVEAYVSGDLANARQELAQCAAVYIRGMEYIDNELKQKGKK